MKCYYKSVRPPVTTCFGPGVVQHSGGKTVLPREALHRRCINKTYKRRGAADVEERGASATIHESEKQKLISLSPLAEVSFFSNRVCPDFTWLFGALMTNSAPTLMSHDDDDVRLVTDGFVPKL